MTRSYFFSGVGGSGMAPLALFMRRAGALVSGSDRDFDLGRNLDKRAYLIDAGLTIAPQDGSGLTAAHDYLVVSTAVEESVPDVISARALGVEIIRRSQLLSSLFNAAPQSLGVGGTSGKSTTTAMAGWILSAAGKRPAIINGANMANFAAGAARYAGSVHGDGPFVAEVDESDGSIDLYNPSVALVTNISLDHKSLEELIDLFERFLLRAKTVVINLDDPHLRAIAAHQLFPAKITYGLTAPDADWRLLGKAGPGQWLVRGPDGAEHALNLSMFGAHNVSNALGAIAAAVALGVDAGAAVAAMADFRGVQRRLEVRAIQHGVTIYDDFAHNPDKIATSLRALKTRHPRILCFFQPHGFKPLELMYHELVAALAQGLSRDDVFWTCDPLYLGGSTTRNDRAKELVTALQAAGCQALFLEDRTAIAAAMAAHAKPDDAAVIMGARDDTLTALCDGVAAAIAARG
jgi:UDP-N-acetylmuramate--alanine ligase